MLLQNIHSIFIAKLIKTQGRQVIILTVTVRDDYIPHGTRWQCTAKTFYYGVSDADWLKLT